MNRIILITAILLSSTISCQNTKEKKIIESIQKEMESIPPIPKEKQVSYAIHANAHTPYEVYLDDILIDFILDGNYISKTTELNPYLLKNGKHKLKVRFLPRIDSKDGLLQPEDIIFSKDARWNIFFTELYKDPEAALGYTNEIDYEKSALPIELPPTPVPFWEQEWELTIDKLPYELEGWSNGQDLSQMDQNELEKEVLAFHKKMRNMLNEGKIVEFMEISKNIDKEMLTALYMTEESMKVDIKDNMEFLTKLCPGNMQPIDNYEMRLFAEGKLVTLLIPNGELKNWGVLLSITPKGRKNYYRLLLYKPKNSEELVIIRV